MVSTPVRIVVCLLALAAACSFAYGPSAYGQSQARFEFSQTHMGARFKIILYASDSSIADRAAQAAFDRVRRLDAIMSDYKETSELIRLCRRPPKVPVPVSRELFDVLLKSQKVARLSGGAFDVTSGPIVRLWRRARRTGELPDGERLKRAIELSGYDKLHLDVRARTVRLDRAGMLLDLGGIAKGYAADQAMSVLKRHGIRRALVAAGGDIVVSDPPPAARGWIIAVASLESSEDLPARSILLSNAAVSTSGDAEQYVKIGGVRYSHIVDPRTGMGLVGQSSATVVARDGATADSLATALSVLGPLSGLRLIDRARGAAAFAQKYSEGGVLAFESKRWKEIPRLYLAR
jgi:thiamine biosynthesis lipoprotein